MQKDDVARIAAGLNERQVRFIFGIAKQRFVPACRWEDRARQKLRKAGLVYYEPKGRKWLLTPLGLAVRNHLTENRDDQ